MADEEVEHTTFGKDRGRGKGQSGHEVQCLRKRHPLPR